jgi:hypothetical protein
LHAAFDRILQIVPRQERVERKHGQAISRRHGRSLTNMPLFANARAKLNGNQAGVKNSVREFVRGFGVVCGSPHPLGEGMCPSFAPWHLGVKTGRFRVGQAFRGGLERYRGAGRAPAVARAAAVSGEKWFSNQNLGFTGRSLSNQEKKDCLLSICMTEYVGFGWEEFWLGVFLTVNP